MICGLLYKSLDSHHDLSPVLVCNAAAIIDSSASKGDDKCLSRGNNKTKASFNENTSVFVRNLPLNVSDDQLFEEF